LQFWSKTHNEGVAMLENGGTSTYCADHGILVFLLKGTAKNPEKLHVASDSLTVEPYALALAHDDEDFRLAVDTALSHIFRADEITEIFARTFGSAKPTDLIEALYTISGLPD
jgi:ABC-type amino acid transport substrate-binding protein